MVDVAIRPHDLRPHNTLASNGCCGDDVNAKSVATQSVGCREDAAVLEADPLLGWRQIDRADRKGELLETAIELDLRRCLAFDEVTYRRSAAGVVLMWASEWAPAPRAVPHVRVSPPIAALHDPAAPPAACRVRPSNVEI